MSGRRIDERTSGRTDGRADGRVNERATAGRATKKCVLEFGIQYLKLHFNSGLRTNYLAHFMALRDFAAQLTQESISCPSPLTCANNMASVSSKMHIQVCSEAPQSTSCSAILGGWLSAQQPFNHNRCCLFQCVVCQFRYVPAIAKTVMRDDFCLFSVVRHGRESTG